MNFLAGAVISVSPLINLPLLVALLSEDVLAGGYKRRCNR